MKFKVNGKKYNWNVKKCICNISMLLMILFDIAFINGFGIYTISKLFN